jgi:hypothetical protein
MPAPIDSGIQGTDSAVSLEKSFSSGSLEKRASLTSTTVEKEELPPIWGKESQPGYKGRRVLGLDTDERNGPFFHTGPLGAYETSFDDIESRPSGVSIPAPVYEMPARYGRKGVKHADDYTFPLASHNNGWGNPPPQRRRLCGLGGMAFWIAFGVIWVLIACAAIGGAIAGVVTSRKAAER